jgi:membrane protein implicated in regulation of membrane protease activity
MYAALWRALPGPLWVRMLLVLAFAAAALYVLATWVFPWVETMITNQEVTVGNS